jgi:Tetratricopeptide repeat
MKGFLRMLAVLFVSISGIATAQTSITQESHGSCSPNIINYGGNVTFICKGVAPEALKALNEQLAKKNLQLSDAVAQANEWVQKYRRLQSELDAVKVNPILVQKARVLVAQGAFKKAEAIVNKLLAQVEKNTAGELKQLAMVNFVKAALLDIQGNDAAALPFYERAYTYDSTNLGFAVLYADHLSDLGQKAKAEVVLRSIADLQIISDDPKTQVDVFVAREQLAMLYMSREKCAQGVAMIDQLVPFLDHLEQLHDTPLKEFAPVVLFAMQAACYKTMSKFADADASIQKAESYLNSLPAEVIRQSPAAGAAFLGFAEYYRTIPGKESKAADFFEKALTRLRDNSQGLPNANKFILISALSIYADFLRVSAGEAAARPYFDEAIGLARSLYEVNPTAYADQYFEVLTAKARSYLSTSDFPAVIELFANDLEEAENRFRHPSNALLKRLSDAESLIGNAFYGLDRLEEARQQFKSAIAHQSQLVDSGSIEALDPLFILFLKQASVCERLSDLVCANDSLNHEIDIAKKLSTVGSQTTSRVPSALNHRARFLADQHKYEAANVDAMESEKTAVSLMTAGISVRKDLFTSMELQLAIAQESDHSKICAVVERSIRYSETDAERQVFIPFERQCDRTR